jgi:hypothetical protein
VSTRLSSAGVLTILAACVACSEKPDAAGPRIWTVFDVQRLYASGKPGSHAIATDAGLPGGIRLDRMLKIGDDGSLNLTLGDTLNRYIGAYPTTEVWANFDRVWLQPMYIPITRWDYDSMTGSQVAVTLKDEEGNNHPVFGVGPESGFYSPYWQIIYFEVPEGTPVDAVTSIRQITEGGYKLTKSIGKTLSLVPDGTRIDPAGSRVSVNADPVATPAIGTPLTGYGWVEGRRVSFLDFGKALCSWDSEFVIEEVPIYHFALRGTDGRLTAPDLPTVAAPGLPGSGLTEPPMIGGKFRYSAFWRVYRVIVPPGARVFAPPQTVEIRPELPDQLANSGFPLVTTYSDEVTMATAFNLRSLIGRIATNPACFDTLEHLEGDPMVPGSCNWLDSQMNIERSVDPSSIRRTEITVTCPVLSVQASPVNPIP